MNASNGSLAARCRKDSATIVARLAEGGRDRAQW